MEKACPTRIFDCENDFLPVRWKTQEICDKIGDIFYSTGKKPVEKRKGTFANSFFSQSAAFAVDTTDFSTFYSFRIHGFSTRSMTSFKSKNPYDTTVFEVFHTFHAD